MLIALCIVAPLLAISLVANLLLAYGRHRARRGFDVIVKALRDSCDDNVRLELELEAATARADGLADDLAFAESLIDEWEADYDGLSGGVLDAMDDLAGARDALDCALADLAGALDDDECDDCGCRYCCDCEED